MSVTRRVALRGARPESFTPPSPDSAQERLLTLNGTDASYLHTSSPRNERRMNTGATETAVLGVPIPNTLVGYQPHEPRSLIRLPGSQNRGNLSQTSRTHLSYRTKLTERIGVWVFGSGRVSRSRPECGVTSGCGAPPSASVDAGPR